MMQQYLLLIKSILPLEIKGTIKEHRLTVTLFQKCTWAKCRLIEVIVTLSVDIKRVARSGGIDLFEIHCLGLVFMRRSSVHHTVCVFSKCTATKRFSIYCVCLIVQST